MTRPLRILVADDDEKMIQYYGRMIPHLGHDLLAAVSNGVELVQSCHALRPNLVLSDIRMPGLDGISAMLSVQRQQCVPFVFVTADDAVDHRPQLNEGYVLDYLQKPVSQSDLSAALETAGCYLSMVPSEDFAVL